MMPTTPDETEDAPYNQRPTRYVLEGRSEPYKPFTVHNANVPIKNSTDLKLMRQKVQDHNRKAGYLKYRLVSR